MGSRVAVVVEDDIDVRDLIELLLSQSGFSVVTALDGPSGVAAVREHNPVLTTIDVTMPGMDGLTAATWLREFSTTYLIMVTAKSTEADIIRGFEAGVDDYLVKPFRPSELRARIDAGLRRLSLAALQTNPSAVEETQTAPESWAAQAARELRAQSMTRIDGSAARMADRWG